MAAEEEADPRRSDVGGKILSRNHWILQERLQFVEKMRTKRCRKLKGGRATAKATAATSEGGKKFST